MARTLTTRYAPSDWTHRALCRVLDEEAADRTFFPPRENAAAAVSAADIFCNQCPVLHECLTFALVHRLSGIYAGMTTDARNKLLKVRTRVKCPVCKAPDPIPVTATQNGRETAWQVCTHCGASWTADRRSLPPLRRSEGSGRTFLESATTAYPEAG